MINMEDQQNETTENEATKIDALNVAAGKAETEFDIEVELECEQDEKTTDSDCAEFELELDYFDEELQSSKLWKIRTGLDEESLCGAIETLIFMSDRPLSLLKIKNHLDEEMPLRVLHESIARLQSEYEQKHHGIRLQEVAEGYQFRTKATYSKYVQDLFKVSSLELTPSAMEVLAILAYRQPVSKIEVEKIRGVDSSHLIRGLIDKRLVKICGRSDELGRPVIYGTTLEFLEVFNLNNLDELPPEYELEEMAATSVGKISDIKNIVHKGDKGQFVFDETDELDSLSQSIKEIAVDTAFTQSLKIEDKKRFSETGEVKKSAFELLESYIERDIIAKQNIQAAASELFSLEGEPTVISDLTAGPFNIPTGEDEEEEFEMIDLDTGLPINDDETQAPLVKEANSLTKALDEISQGLEKSVDFDAFFDEKEVLSADEELDLSAKMQNIDDNMANLLEKAQDFDIDLDLSTESDNVNKDISPPD